MKIRNPFLMKFGSWVGTRIIRTIGRSMRYKSTYIDENWIPDSTTLSRRAIFLFWHEYMVLPAYRYASDDVHVLVSSHNDGQLIGGMIKRLGLRTVVGSSSRKGTEALRQMLKISRESHIVITPDGPRGPRREVKAGAIFLAAKTGLPIIPVGIGYSRARRLKTWDKLAIPKLFSKGRVVNAPAVYIPRDVTIETLEPYRQKIESQMLALTTIAERWAGTGQYHTEEFDLLRNG
ncbi:MAG: lysophospholipid acyltransferase family protein [Planctomycetes bacterium]|nr:lysophospholipid acyltransferase family protein [Planctomycetota bacterium]